MEGRRARGRERGLGLARTELPGPNGRAGPRPVQRRALAPHQALRTGRQAGASTRSTTKTTTAPATRARRQRLLSQPAATRGIAATGSRLGADAGLDDVGPSTPLRVLGAASPLRRFGTTGSVRRGAPFRLARRFLTQSPVRASKGHADGRDAARNCTPDLLAALGVRGVADRPPKAGAELALRSDRGMGRAPGVRGPFDALAASVDHTPRRVRRCTNRSSRSCFSSWARSSASSWA